MERKIVLAKTAGFCFGVDRAVKLCNRLLEEGRRPVTLGPIIHNAGVVEELRDRGCPPVDSLDQVPEGAVLVIRSHGVEKSVLEECGRRGIGTADATCPFVAKIHRIVGEAGKEGRHVLIAGDPDHPEVKGIAGYCEGPRPVVRDLEELEAAAASLENGASAVLVSQTTFDRGKFADFCAYLKKNYTNILFYDTICTATHMRQEEAERLSRTCDMCVVIGGHNSSNTRKLSEICRRNAPTVWIEKADELEPEMLLHRKIIGVTAGASTPFPVIEEVLTKMSEMENNTVFDFEAELEESLKPVRRGQRVEGTVIEIKPNEVLVDIGRKHTGFIPTDELSSDPSANPEDVVKIGETYLFKVIKVEDLEGRVTLSKKAVENEAGMNDLVAAYESGEVVDAYITEVVSKGLVANVKGARVFIPGSQATLRRGEPFDGLLHTHQAIKIIEADKEHRRAIGSIRAVLEAENAKKREEFFANAEIGKVYEGTVKSLTSYGAFVDLGGVDGMVHVSELSWKRIHNPAEVLSVGDVITVFIKDIDEEKGRISLGYRKEEDNPWNAIHAYELNTWFEAPVVSVTKFGAFVRILPDLDGLVHLSEMSVERIDSPAKVVKVGDVVKVRLIGVDDENKRISLSMLEEGVKDAAREAARAAKAARQARKAEAAAAQVEAAPEG